MKWIVWLVGFAVTLVAVPGMAAAPLVLVDHGKSDYEIVRAADCPRDVRIGAAELQRLIEKATGAKLPIVEAATDGMKQIVIGADPLATKAGISADALPPDGFRMVAREGRIFLIGRDENGPLYLLNNNKSTWVGSYFAVIEFARQFLSARWYMPTEMGEEVPRAEVLNVPADLDITCKPAMARRQIAGMNTQNLQSFERWKKQGLFKTGIFEQESWDEAVTWGRRMMLGNDFQFEVSHSWYQWMPAEHPTKWSQEAYGQTHPEWYALVTRGGSGAYRVGSRENHYYMHDHRGELDVSNEAMRAQFAANIIAYAKKTGQRVFSISPNDGGPQCDCDNCRDWGYGTDPTQGHPTMTDRMIRFANDIARRVKSEIPDIQLGLYAYDDYRTPPTREQVDPSITISDVRNMLPFFYYSPGGREKMEANILAWRAKVSRIVFTTYYTGDDFWSLPWSTSDALGWLMKTLASSPSSKGCYVSFDNFDPIAVGARGPDPWILARLMWDPSLSVEGLEKEWYDGCFGPEIGPIIRQYFDTIHASMSRTIERHPFDGNMNTTRDYVEAYRPIRDECDRLIGRAVSLAAGMPARYQWRVDRVARSWRMAALTLDAIDATKAMKENPADRSLRKKAVEAGETRWKLLHDPASQFALMSNGTEYMDSSLPLPLLTEAPRSADLNIPFVQGEIHVDGLLNDPAWKKAVKTPMFLENRKGDEALTQTTARLFYNREGLAVMFECGEPDMAKLKTVNDPGHLWDGDVVEIYISPPGAETPAHFTVNPDNMAATNIPGDWSHAAARFPGGWQVEIFIPWNGKELQYPAGKSWSADLFRERYTALPENSAWVPTGGGFAQPVRFGVWQFAQPTAGQ